MGRAGSRQDGLHPTLPYALVLRLSDVFWECVGEDLERMEGNAAGRSATAMVFLLGIGVLAPGTVVTGTYECEKIECVTTTEERPFWPSQRVTGLSFIFR